MRPSKGPNIVALLTGACWIIVARSADAQVVAPHDAPPGETAPHDAPPGETAPHESETVPLEAPPGETVPHEGETVPHEAPPVVEAPAGEPAEPAPPAPAAESQGPPPVTFGGYVEAFYGWNFGEPSNGITHFRGFDNRHNSFTLANVALDAAWDLEGVVGRITLQVGHTPSTYYLAEPSVAGAGGTNPSGAELWKYLQQAHAGYRFDVGGGLTVSAGLFLSPIGPESMAVHESWNWSRSHLFFGLPFYHTGLRATYAVSEAWSVTLAGYNGWNSVVDNNDEKSVSAQLAFSRPDLAVSVVYFGGTERPTGAPEGRGWRHTLDAHATWHPAPWASLLAHANAGLEPTTFGLSHWAAGALSARFRLLPEVFVAARGDAFHEHAPTNGEGRAAAIFWPVPWVASATATLDVRPHPQVSFRLEVRHDHAAGDLFFGGTVAGDGAETPYAPNRAAQDTVTLGSTAWF